MLFGKAAQSSSLIALFDRSAAASAFEILQFLHVAEAKRLSLLLESMHVYVISDGDGDFNSQTRYSGDTSALNDFVGCMGLLPSVHGYTIASSREEACKLLEVMLGPATGGDGGDRAPRDVATPPELINTSGLESEKIAASVQLKASSTASHYIDRWIEHAAGGRRIVSITVDAGRSMNDAALADLVKWLKNIRQHLSTEQYCIVLAPVGNLDLPTSVLDAAALSSCPGVGASVDLRVALYARAYVNIFHGRTSASFFGALPECPALLFEGDATVRVGEYRRQLPIDLGDEDIARELSWVKATVSETTDGKISTTKQDIKTSVEGAYELAVRLYKSSPETIAKAISIFREILRRKPDHADSLAMLALAAHKFKKHEQAVQLLEQALLINNTDPAYYFNLGNAHFALRQYDEALVALQRAIELDHTLFEAYDIMSEIHRYQRHYEKALHCHERSCTLHGKWFQANVKMAECLFALGNVNEALTKIRSFIDKLLYMKANDRASAVMIWPWCARPFSSREATFLLGRYPVPEGDRSVCRGSWADAKTKDAKDEAQ